MRITGVNSESLDGRSKKSNTHSIRPILGVIDLPVYSSRRVVGGVGSEMGANIALSI